MTVTASFPLPPRDSFGNLAPMPNPFVTAVQTEIGAQYTVTAPSGSGEMLVVASNGTTIGSGTSVSFTATVPGVVIVVKSPAPGYVTVSLVDPPPGEIPDPLTLGSLITKTQPVVNGLAFGADPSGATDSTAAIQAAINAAGGQHPGRVVLPPGRYLISEPLVLQGSDASATVPQPVPLLTGLVAPGRIGDTTDTSSTVLVCSPTFPVGEYAVQVLGPNANLAPTGGGAQNLEVNCNQRGAGILAHQPRRCVFNHLAIIGAAAPLPYTDQPFRVAPTGAFSVVESSGTASAYNYFNDIVCAYAAADSFNYATSGKDHFWSCYSVNPGQANDGGPANAYNVSGHSSWHGCDYTGGEVAWNISANDITIAVFSSLIAVGTLTAPSGQSCNAVLLSAAGATDSNSLVAFYGCRLYCNPAADQGAVGAIVRVTPGGNDNIVNALFSGCTFLARGIETTPTATAFVWVESGVTGTVAVEGCSVSGTPTTAPFEDQAGGVIVTRGVQGFNPAGPQTAPTVPASGTALANPFPFDTTVYISGGTVTEVAIGGTSTGLTSGAFSVPAGESITLTYSAAPTWVWVGN